MTRRSLLTLLLIGLLLASCGPSADGQPTPDIQATIAANAETMVAALFQTQTALAPAATNTPLPTITSLPSSTALALSTATVFVAQGVYLSPTPTGTYYTATPLASSLGVGCNNLGLVESWTDPDSPLVAGQSFTQYWQVANTGTCNWMYVYAWTFVSGDKFGETTSVRLGKLIEPGKWTTFSVNMRAPNNSGTYKASWRLTDGNTSFGATLPISITVGGSTKTPKPDTDATNTAAQKTADAAQQNAINTAVAQRLTQSAVNATASAVAATASAVAATAACAVTPDPPAPPIPPCQ
jgi:hypothetical protein